MRSKNGNCFLTYCGNIPRFQIGEYFNLSSINIKQKFLALQKKIVYNPNPYPDYRNPLVRRIK